MARTESYLIGIRVRLDQGATPVWEFASWPSVKNPEKVRIRRGSLVAWTLGVLDKNGQALNPPPPYRISFKQDGFFQDRTVDVVGGGASGYFPIKAIKGRHQYSIEVPSLGLLKDPEIQIETNDGTLMEFNDATTVAQHVIAVTLKGGVYTFTHNSATLANGAHVPLATGDKVTFTFEVDPAPNPPVDLPFSIRFEQNHTYGFPTPFKNESEPNIEGDNEIGPYEVEARPNSDKHYRWSFKDDGKGVDQNVFTFDLP